MTMGDESRPTLLSRFFIRYGVWLTLGLVVLLSIFWVWSYTPQLSALNQLQKLTDELAEHTTQLKIAQQKLLNLSPARADQINWRCQERKRKVKQFFILLTQLPSQETKFLTQRIQQLKQTFSDQCKIMQTMLRHYSVVRNTLAQLAEQGEACEANYPANQHADTSPLPHEIYTKLSALPYTIHVDKHHLREAQALITSFTPPDTPVCRNFSRLSHTFLKHFTQFDELTEQLNHRNPSRMLSLVESYINDLRLAMQQRHLTGQKALYWTGALLSIFALIALLLAQQHARALERQQTTLKRQSQRYRALSDINELIIHSEDTDTLLKKALEILTKATQVPAAAVWHSPDEHGYLRRLQIYTASADFQAGLDRLKVNVRPSVPEGRGVTGIAWRTGKLQVVQDVRTLPNYAVWRPLIKQYNINSVVTLPLTAHGQTQYVITLFHTDARWPESEDLHLLKEAKEDLSFALEKLHWLSTLKQQSVELKLAEAAFNAHESIVITDSEGHILRANGSTTKLSGYQLIELLHRDIKQLIHKKEAFSALWETLYKEGYAHTELNLRHKDGHPIPVLISATLVQPEETEQHYLVFQLMDLSPIRHLEKQLLTAQYTDPITRLPNRKSIELRLQHLLDIMPDKQFGMLSILNIRHFKTINEAYGHKTGDELLKKISKRIKRTLSIPHLLGRNTTDEFILFPFIFSETQTDVQTQWETQLTILLEQLALPYEIENKQIQLEFYAGTTVIQKQGELNADEILRQAESAAHRGKELRHLTHFYYDGRLNKVLAHVFELRSELESALEANELRLYYQPILSLKGRHIQLAEALIRWKKGAKLIPPGEFIPALEQSPTLMRKVGYWIIRQACKDLAILQTHLDPDFSLSINLSPIQLYDEKLLPTLLEAIQLNQCKPQTLTLEITETVLMEDVNKALEALNKLHAHGFPLAIDDFGTGHSSLRYVQMFDPDKIKLDKTFIDPLANHQKKEQVIVEATIAMSHKLSAKVIAEGVETAEQQVILEALGCDMIQGYLVSRPVPLDELLAMLRPT